MQFNEGVILFLTGQLIGAIGWGIKVQIRLAAIEHDATLQAAAIQAGQKDLRELSAKMDKIGDSLIRLEEGQRHVIETLKTRAG